MAGKIEEPISFQVDSLHSGSISFGRFETESLSWERRSSFSHNRYLEEVEKYSTPGSVTQKKAYFEAHFKKKALLLQASSECPNGMEYQINENDMQDYMNYTENFEHTEGSHFAHYDERPHGSDYHGECDLMGFEREDDYDESSHGSVYHGECGDEGIPSFGFQMEPILTIADTVLDVDLQHVEPGEVHETQFECNTLPLVKNETEIKINHKLSDEPENVVGSPKSTISSPKNYMAEKDDSPSMKKSQKPALKVKDTTKTKASTSKLRAQVSKKISSEAPKDSAKNSRTVERETALRTKTEKRSPQKVSPSTSLMRTLKPEVKSSQDNRSEKDLRAKKASTKPQPSASEKDQSKACQSKSRPKRTVNSTKPGIKPSSAGFNFKSDERAEKRKEFFMKLEEKMHAKEVEMNQIHARTQEETEADIKQLRRSLNFKATPMPSFYHDIVPRGSNGKKAVSSHVQSTKLRSKSTSPGSIAASRSPAFPEAGNQQGLSASESVNSTAQPQTSEATDCPTTVSSDAADSSPIASTNRNDAPQTGKRIEGAGKKEREKGTDSKMLKQGLESGKAKKERVKGRRVVGGVGDHSEVVRKVIKGVGMGMDVGGGSRMGRLTVDVAS